MDAGGNIVRETAAGVRRAAIADVPRLVDLARECYPGRDLSHAAEWARNLIRSPQAAIFFAARTCITAMWQVEFWEANRRVADVLPVFSQPAAEAPWALIRCFEAARDWAAENGCYALRFGSSLGARSKNHDQLDVFAIIARRLDAPLWGKTYMMEIG